MGCRMPGFTFLHYLLEFAQTHVHWVSDAIQPSHPLSSPCPLAFNLSQDQDLFQWVGFLHQVAKVLELQLQHQSFQWILRIDFLTNPDSTLKIRAITVLTKVRIVKAIVSPVVIYRCESWTLKKVEHWRIDAFELWCWRRLLRAFWTGRRSNESILKEINPEYSLEGLMLQSWSWCSRSWSWSSNTLATWFEEPTHWKRSWCY